MNYDSLLGCKIKSKEHADEKGICIGYHQNPDIQTNTTVTWFTYLKDNGEFGFIKYGNLIIPKDQYGKIFNNIKTIQEKKLTRNELLDLDT